MRRIFLLLSWKQGYVRGANKVLFFSPHHHRLLFLLESIVNDKYIKSWCICTRTTKVHLYDNLLRRSGLVTSSGENCDEPIKFDDGCCVFFCFESSLNQ